MKNNIILVIISIVIGCLLSKFMFNQYDKDATINVANLNSDTYYFLEIGVFDSYDGMIVNNNNLDNYIYLEDNNMFHVFTCITTDLNNNQKIEDYYKEQGYSITTNTYNLTNDTLYSDIKKIDLLLNETEDKTSINALCKESLNKYKEAK